MTDNIDTQGSHVEQGAVLVGNFFDGKTSCRQVCQISLRPGKLFLRTPEWERVVPSQEVEPITAQAFGPLFIQLPEGACLEVVSSPALMGQLECVGIALRVEPSLAAMVHKDWRVAATVSTFLVCVVVALYVWLLPNLVESVAAMIPASWESALGRAALAQMDGRVLSPSQVPSELQEAIRGRFDELVDGSLKTKSKDFRIELRKSSMGPNAFALPGNVVVLTDELVDLVDGDIDAIAGVLGHELGHAKGNHAMRGLIQAVALASLTSAIVGDYSAIISNASAVLGTLSYSRSFEAEADAYSRDLLCNKGIDPSHTADFFDKVRNIKGNVGEMLPEFARTHPDTAGRAAFYRRGC